MSIPFRAIKGDSHIIPPEYWDLLSASLLTMGLQYRSSACSYPNSWAIGKAEANVLFFSQNGTGFLFVEKRVESHVLITE